MNRSKFYLCLVFGLVYLATASFVSAQTSSEILIKQLQEQIKLLQAQITELNAKLEVTKKEAVVTKEELKTTKEEVKELKEEIKITRTLRKGIKGEEVKELQEFLSQFPDIYPEGQVTGFFGLRTEMAVKKLQEKYGIQAIGVVGPKTISKINELLSEGAGKSGIVPPGLLRSPGIEKKLEVGSFQYSTSTFISPVTISSVGTIATTTIATTTPVSTSIVATTTVAAPAPIGPVQQTQPAATSNTGAVATPTTSTTATTTTTSTTSTGTVSAQISSSIPGGATITRGATNVSVASFSVTNLKTTAEDIISLKLVCQGCSSATTPDFTAMRIEIPSSSGTTTVNGLQYSPGIYEFYINGFLIPAGATKTFTVKVDTSSASSSFQSSLNFYIEWRSASLYTATNVTGLPLYVQPSSSLVWPTVTTATTATTTPTNLIAPTIDYFKWGSFSNNSDLTLNGRFQYSRTSDTKALNIYIKYPNQTTYTKYVYILPNQSSINMYGGDGSTSISSYDMTWWNWYSGNLTASSLPVGTYSFYIAAVGTDDKEGTASAIKTAALSSAPTMISPANGATVSFPITISINQATPGQYYKYTVYGGSTMYYESSYTQSTSVSFSGSSYMTNGNTYKIYVGSYDNSGGAFSITKQPNAESSFILGSAQASVTCSDSDGGQNYSTKGTTIGWLPAAIGSGSNDDVYSTKDDYCRSVNADGSDPNWVQEYLCTSQGSTPQGRTPYITQASFYCTGGCSNGACISTTTSLYRKELNGLANTLSSIKSALEKLLKILK